MNALGFGAAARERLFRACPRWACVWAWGCTVRLWYTLPPSFATRHLPCAPSSCRAALSTRYLYLLCIFHAVHYVGYLAGSGDKFMDTRNDRDTDEPVVVVAGRSESVADERSHRMLPYASFPPSALGI